MKPKSQAQASRDSKIRQAAEAVEELLWLLNSKRGATLKTLPALLRQQIEDGSNLNAVAGHYASPNPNKHFLIGVLPRLFQDTQLFPTNEDIAEFARTVLHVEISRYEKRSKYELIGFIVCQTNDLDERQLSNLVEALAIVTGSEEKLKRVVEARKGGRLNWNEAIQQMTLFRDE